MRRLTAYITTLATLLCVAGTQGARAQGYDVGGVIIDPATMTAMDMFNLSQANFNFGTARSAAMAGAFTSLGADMASAAINPAGLGMYRRSELSLTPMLSFSRSHTNADSFEKTNSTKFSLPNVGLVLNLHESDRGVTAVNLGFSFNRTADFNYRYSYGSHGQRGSIADAYARQLYDADLTSDYLKSENFSWSSVDPSLWGATLGYLTGLDGDGSGQWDRDMIGHNANVGQVATVESSGSANEFLISLGMNVGSKVYIGASLGIQSVTMTRNIYYGENYTYSSDPGLDYRMDYFNYDQWAKVNGAGVNFKIGVIYRPVAGLRIGVAFHTPTYYSLTYKYRGGMTSQVKAINNVDGYTLGADGYINPALSESTPTLVDDGNNSWAFTSPTRLLVGASYTFGKLAVISVDYQRDWYNGMRTKSSPFGKGYYDNFARDQFRGSNTLRVGAEIKPIPQIALRAGYGLFTSGLKDRTQIFSSPMIYRTDYVGGGVGIMLSKAFFIDLTYQYMQNRLTDYMSWYYYAGTDEGASPVYTTRLNRHMAMVTLGVRF